MEVLLNILQFRTNSRLCFFKRTIAILFCFAWQVIPLALAFEKVEPLLLQAFNYFVLNRMIGEYGKSSCAQRVSKSLRRIRRGVVDNGDIHESIVLVLLQH